jgi:hypothetical protein
VEEKENLKLFNGARVLPVLFAASGTRQAITAVDGHPLAKCRDLLRETILRLGGQAGNPIVKRALGGCKEPLPFLRLQLCRLREGRELCGMEDLIGIGVADAAEEAGIGEGALERVIFRRQRRPKSREIGLENVDSTGVQRAQTVLAADDVQRRAPLRARFGERERPFREIECRQILTAADLRATRPPVQPSRDHQVQNKPNAAFHANRDALTDATNVAYNAVLRCRRRRFNGAQQERSGHTHAFQRLANNARFECRDVRGYVRQFRHPCISMDAPRIKEWVPPTGPVHFPCKQGRDFARILYRILIA